jgi:hypothetical protein
MLVSSIESVFFTDYLYTIRASMHLKHRITNELTSLCVNCGCKVQCKLRILPRHNQ